MSPQHKLWQVKTVADFRRLNWVTQKWNHKFITIKSKEGFDSNSGMSGSSLPHAKITNFLHTDYAYFPMDINNEVDSEE